MSVTVGTLYASAAAEFIGIKLADVAAAISHDEDAQALQHCDVRGR